MPVALVPILRGDLLLPFLLFFLFSFIIISPSRTRVHMPGAAMVTLTGHNVLLVLIFMTVAPVAGEVVLMLG